MNAIEARIERLVATSETNREVLAERLEAFEAQSVWADRGYQFYQNWSPLVGSVVSTATQLIAGRKAGHDSKFSKATAAIQTGLKLWNLWKNSRISRRQ